MLIPTKHEKLENNILVIGAELISLIKKHQGNYDIESLFQKLKENKNVSLDLFYDTVLFLWLSNIIKKQGYLISINK